MQVEWFASHVLPAAFALLPARLDSTEARALVTAICLQESGLESRKQVVRLKRGDSPALFGPARGLAQFEPISCTEVMTHHGTRDAAKAALTALLYPNISDIEAHAALEHNDVLAVVFARLLLWPDRERLPTDLATGAAWAYYLRRWRPGRPRPEEWAGNWEAAWAAVDP